MFFFKGSHVYSARFDRDEILGVGPMTFRISVGATVSLISTEIASQSPLRTLPDGSVQDFTATERRQSTPWFALDHERFASHSAFQERLKALPTGTIVEWQQSDVGLLRGRPPLDTAQEVSEFAEFCRQQGLRLIIYPGG